MLIEITLCYILHYGESYKTVKLCKRHISAVTEIQISRSTPEYCDWNIFATWCLNNLDLVFNAEAKILDVYFCVTKTRTFLCSQSLPYFCVTNLTNKQVCDAASESHHTASSFIAFKNHFTLLLETDSFIGIAYALSLLHKGVKRLQSGSRLHVSCQYKEALFS